MTVPLLFKIPDVNIEGSKIAFQFEESDPNYPCVILDKEKSKLAEKYQLNSDACQINENDRTVSYQLALFWHYMG